MLPSHFSNLSLSSSVAPEIEARSQVCISSPFKVLSLVQIAKFPFPTFYVKPTEMSEMLESFNKMNETKLKGLLCLFFVFKFVFFS